jgi:hypothetical protein
MKMPNFIRSSYRSLAIVRLALPWRPPAGSPQGLPRHLTTVPIAGTIAETGDARMRLIKLRGRRGRV